MRSRHFVVASLGVGDRAAVLTDATLVVVERDDTDADWEVIAHCRDAPDVERGVHDLSMTLLDLTGEAPGSIAVTGPALLVRKVDQCLVFRGTGPLAGLD